MRPATPGTSHHRPITRNAVRAAVMGANDGLVSILNLVMGVAGAALPGRSIAIAGMAGLLAGAISMALGEWISVQSARELARRELAVEARELEEQPAVEEAELVGFFRAKGLDDGEARALAARLMANEAAVLDIMAKEELGIDPRDLGGSAWEAAASSFVLFVVGAAIPVLPFFVASGRQAVVASVAASAAGLVVLGAAIGWINGRSVLYSAGRQVAIGLAAAAVTYALGDRMNALLAQGG